jgi:hypothetical protein
MVRAKECQMSKKADRIEKRVEELKRELGSEQGKLAIQLNIEAAEERIIAAGALFADSRTFSSG